MSIIYLLLLYVIIFLMNNCSVTWGCCGSKDINSRDGDVPSWNPPELEVTWKKGEDLRVILADRGVFKDHMPTHVITTLRAYHK